MPVTSELDALPVELLDGLGARSARRVSGGDIANAYRLETAGGPLFAKTLPAAPAGLFEAEAAGLRALHAHAPRPLRVPEVLRASASGLVLEWIEPSSDRPADGEAVFGQALAELHRTTAERFGGLDGATSGYLGAVPVDLTADDDWPSFYAQRRVAPLVRAAVDAGRLDPQALGVLERLMPKAAERCGPPEPPALLHGDLWAGNRIVDRGGVSWLIDPSAHWGHREYDLAMMRLFGGFGAECFTAYEEVAPLADGWRDRVEWYQLVPLLVHAILFGGPYGAAALQTMRRYA